MAIVNGFACLRVNENEISLAPTLPASWNGYRFKFVYRGRLIKVTVDKENVSLELIEGDELSIRVYDKTIKISSNEKKVLNMEG